MSEDRQPMAAIAEMAPRAGSDKPARAGRARRGSRVRRPRVAELAASGNRETGRINDFDVIVGHPLHPVTVPHTYPWCAIVLLKIKFQSGATGHGTGWFFSPSRIATAAHNLLHPHEGAAIGMDILAGWDGAQASEQFRISSKHVPPAWAPPWDEANDWAIFATDRPAAKQTGYFGYRAYDQGYPAGLQLFVSGYPGDKYGVSPVIGVAGVDQQCWDSGQIAAVTPVEVDYAISTAPGMSGAPAFIWDNNVGIAIGIHTQGKITTNGARRIDQMLAATLTTFWA